jgi:hypothetical protein
LRPLGRQSRPGISCIIPARNERGNIENALKRFPDLGCETEIVFVEAIRTTALGKRFSVWLPFMATAFEFKRGNKLEKARPTP